MPEIIAGIYRIDKKIGSGGGGVVYIGEHIRLGKRIVLKADKRKITAKPEILRREVDALKNLSHTYIPQVYDFVTDGDTVYTVMDYIEGESLDKPLKRGERFSQPEIIKWSCQLLEALSYMHSRPPHGILHGDIKPANIMLDSEGNICLIDFNIALALGEEGAVKVGYSQGYASPEHYGFDFSKMPEVIYSSDSRQNSSYISLKGEQGESNDAVSGYDNVSETETMVHKSDDITLTMVNSGNDATLTMLNKSTDRTLTMVQQLDDNTVTMAKVQDEVGGPYSSKRSVMLDVRSDIYSLGATLYHLITGRRPSKNIDEIQEITPQEASQALIKIIEKAMQPNPELRYQSADEMLTAFKNLRSEDPRSIKLKRAYKVTAAVVSIFLATGIAMSFTGLNQIKQTKASYALASDSEEALRRGDTAKAVSLAEQALQKHGIFSAPYTAEAQKALSNALGVYDLSDGMKDTGSVSLKSEALKMSVSDNGKYIAAVYSGGVAIIDADTIQITADLPAEPSALSDAVFATDNLLLYAGAKGVTAYSISENKELWVGSKATGICVSADGTRAACVYKDASEAVVYDAKTGKDIMHVSFDGRKQPVTVNDSFADPNDEILALNQNGTMLAASFSDGSLTVFDLNDREKDLIVYEKTDYTHFEGGFYDKYFAFSSTKKGESMYMSVDCESAEAVSGFGTQSTINVKADESGIYLCNEGTVVKIDPLTGEQDEKAYITSMCADYAITNEFTVIAAENGELSYFDNKAAQMSGMENSKINSKNTQKTDDTELHYGMVAASGKTAVAGAVDSNSIRIMQMKDNSDSQIFAYDPAYDHDEARISADGKTVMLFSYKGFRLCSIDGSVICDTDMPDADQIYDQQYRRNGSDSYLEVIYNDGMHRCYSASDGSVISEEKGEIPDQSLYEEFETDHIRIESPLHGTPIAYDKKNNKKIKELESDDYLTYVTQAGEYLITEYITADGERYGLLLDKKCKAIAYLPELCDYVDGKLIFDYRTGDLRGTRIYSIDELIAMGRSAEK